MIARSSPRRATATGDFAIAIARAGVAAILLGVIPPAAQAQAELTPAERNCWDKFPGHVEYVKCLASIMEPIDPAKRDWYGEFYGAKQYLNCALTRPQGDTSCDKHRLKRRPQPEYWPYEGKVPPMKWPEAPKEAVYRKGMKPKEYFDALCKEEAGEFISRTVEGVEGIFQVRPRLPAGTYELRDRYVMEDPYGYSAGEARLPAFRFVGPGGYQFFETPKLSGPRPSHEKKHFDASFFVAAPPDAKLERYRYKGAAEAKPWGSVTKEFDTAVRSLYGYTWREVPRVMDRELGVVGGELIILDLRTNEILGFRRGFAFSGYIENVEGGFQWEIARMCPSSSNRTGGDLAPAFVKKVLKPALATRASSSGGK